MATDMTIPAGRLRVPNDVREAVGRGEVVTVTDRDRSAYVIINPEAYALVSPLIERGRHGLSIPIERLLTPEDLAVMSVDDEEDEDAIGLGILESWND